MDESTTATGGRIARRIRDGGVDPGRLLAATPDVCREEQPPVDVANAMSCAIQGQVIAQEWLDEHPKWLLRGWRCRYGRAERAT